MGGGETRERGMEEEEEEEGEGGRIKDGEYGEWVGRIYSQTERQTVRQTDRQTHRQTDRRTDRCLTDGASLLVDLSRHGLVEVLELDTETEITKLDGVIREEDIGSWGRKKRGKEEGSGGGSE